MRKHLILLAAFALMATAASAQSAYDKQHHYDAASNIEVGASVHYTRNMKGGLGNLGADLRATKRIGSHARLRALANVPGFLSNGFDRYGTALVGLSADFLPFYVFLDGGISINPSSPQTINPAADAGVGLHFDIGRNLRMFTEIGADVTSNGLNQYRSNGFVKLGYTYSTGITEADRQELSIKHNSQQLLTELSDENKTMRAEVDRLREANTQLQSTLDRATAAIESSNQMLQDYKAAAADAPSVACDFMVYFPYASAELDEIELERLWDKAQEMKATGADYRIEGYSSPDGDLYRNEMLARDRAYYVYRTLVGYGIDEERLSPSGEGIGELYAGGSSLNRCVKITKIVR